MNIVEGSSKSDNEFHQALTVSLGSAGELEYQALLSRDLAYLLDGDYAVLDAKIKREKRMLVAFMKALKPRPGLSERGRPRPTANGQRPATGLDR